MFIVDQVIMKILYERDDIDKKCYRCENLKHMIRKCFFSKIIDISLFKKIKQKKYSDNQQNEQIFDEFAKRIRSNFF